ncbi:MAG: DUF2975 domain-containing protein [Weeksellaceae bacterium]
MKQGSTLFLKVVLFLIAAVIMTALLWLPQLEGRAKNLDLIGIYSDPFILYIYLASVPFFTGFYQAIKLLGYIEQNKTFTALAVKSLRNIKYCAIAFSLFCAGALPNIMIYGQDDDAPGVVLLGVVIIFAAFVIATAAAVFERLLQNAVDMKSENDLTV